MNLACSNGCKQRPIPIQYPYCGHLLPVFKCPGCGNFRLSEVVTTISRYTTREFPTYEAALNYALEAKK